MERPKNLAASWVIYYESLPESLITLLGLVHVMVTLANAKAGRPVLPDQLETHGGKAILFNRHLTFGRVRRLTCVDLP